MKQLAKKLSELKKLGATSLKQSLEDEAATYKDIKYLRKITKKLGLNLNVKIGGCEARNDINFCRSIKVDALIAPMVESEYALRKFMQSVSNNKKNLYINLETITAIKNIKKILNCNDAKFLKGIVFGRSDIAGSLNMKKKDVDKKKIYNLIHDSSNFSKKKKLVVKMGGSITEKSELFIKTLFKKQKVDYFETRNIEIKISEKTFLHFDQIIKKIFNFELELLKIKQKINSKSHTFFFKNRIKEIKKRILFNEK